MLLLVALRVVHVAAQTVEGDETLRLSTRIVVLDVVVTDKAGRLVDRVFTREDFTIVEDRVPQTIRSFEAPAAHALDSAVQVESSADLKRIGDSPVTLLVLDELNTPLPDMAFQREQAVRYLASQPARLAQPTVLLVAGNTRFLQLHDYTQDRDALIAAIRHHMPAIPTKQMAGRGPAAVERMAQSLASLEQMAQASSGTPGRKNVIWIGDGFPSVNPVLIDPKTSATIEAAVAQCTNMLLAARMTMYTINPTANQTATVDALTPEDLEQAEQINGGDPFSGNIAFSAFAPATGGRAFQSRNDLHNEIAEGIAAGANYYTLSYAPAGDVDDLRRYRTVRVVMRDKNLRATTRDGYFPPTAATMNIALSEPKKQADAELKMELSSAVNSAITYNGLEFKATLVGTNYVLQVKSAGLSFRAVEDGNEKAECTVLAAWYDAKGKLLGHSGRELLSRRPATGEQPTQAVFTLPAPTLPPGTKRLRLIVRDAVNARMGTVDLTP